MKCFYHIHEDATATCNDCLRTLCKECTTIATPILCPHCKVDRAYNKKSQLQYKLLFRSICGLIFIVFGLGLLTKPNLEMDFATILISFVLFSIPFGYAEFDERFNKDGRFITSSIVLNLLLSVVKLAGSTILGPIAMTLLVLKYYKSCKDFKRLKRPFESEIVQHEFANVVSLR